MQAGRHNLSLNKTDGDQHPFIDYATYEMQTQFSIIVIRTPTQYNKKSTKQEEEARCPHNPSSDRSSPSENRSRQNNYHLKKLLILQ